MKVSVTYSDIWKIAYPIILGSLATTVLNLTDTAFIARVGETELGAMAIATVFYFVIIMIGLALGTGSQIIMARRAGEGNSTEIGKIFDHSFLLLLLLSILSFFAVKFFSPQLLVTILRSGAVAKAANDFMGSDVTGSSSRWQRSPFGRFLSQLERPG
jgi:Na+-driven multidrug efflux pump